VAANHYWIVERPGDPNSAGPTTRAIRGDLFGTGRRRLGGGASLPGAQDRDGSADLSNMNTPSSGHKVGPDNMAFRGCSAPRNLIALKC